jgi:co-chaperonin GroES (HSP10)
MRTYNYFVVELEKLINDTLVTDSGLELHIDHKYNENGEFENRVTEGPVVCSPFKIDTGVRPGDTLYFHHLVVMQGGQVLTGDDKHYIVKCSKEALSNQAIAYKDQDTDEIKPLFGWSLLEPVEEEEFPNDLIEMVQLTEKLPTKGRVAFESEELNDIGVEVGDVVGFKENRDYRIKIDGKEYYRTRVEDLLYAEA